GIKLPEEIHASCVAVVLGEAFAGKAPRTDKDDAAAAKLPRVTLAEIEAHSAFDGATMEGLVGALAGGGDHARGAAALLARGGSPAIQALVAGFSRLDDDGKRLAEGVIDGAPCGDQVPFFAARVAALSAVAKPAPAQTPAPGAPPGPRIAPRSDEDPDRAHARDRLRRCGRASASALADLVRAGTPEVRVLAADELALVAPAEAVPVLLDALALASADDGLRRDLRAALARAAKSPHALGALRDEVEEARFKARPETVALDLLRAAGPALGSIDGAAKAFAFLATPQASFRSRYLLQAPAAALAQSGDAGAEAFLRASLRKDAAPEVRARAAEVAGKVRALGDELGAAVDDPEPRVRKAAIDAAIEALEGGLAAPAGLAASLTRRLTTDEWTFVRAGAARALGALPAGDIVDGALVKALADLAPDVRGRAIEALGAHQATRYADAIRERADLADELPEVRARAIFALASLCDRRSLDDWTKRAERSKAPLDELDRRLGAASIAALGRVHPADLDARLAPLLAKDSPPMVREMARSALAAETTCPR
ncbi:MAG: HEAT repeat domain-containing protein, partial [Minicystis sp.]